jgi:hypothetical protein
MLSAFWTGASGKLAERWVAAILSPAFIFWTGGILVAGQLDNLAWKFGSITGTEQVAVLVGAFVLVAVSGAVVAAVSPSIIRALEGYWPRPLNLLAGALTRRRSDHDQRTAERWRMLARAQADGTMTTQQHREYARLDMLIGRTPPQPDTRMPTRLGNILRAAEQRPRDRYGLEAVACWPRLWLVLPDTARTEVSTARHELDVRAELWLWAILFSTWAVYTWWAPLIAVTVAAAVYRSLCERAVIYGDLFVATYDLYRVELYRALAWPLPDAPQHEAAAGAALSRYLVRGAVPQGSKFERDSSKS